MKASKVIAAFMAAGLFLTSTGCTSSKAKQKAAMEDALDSYVSKVLAGKDASKYVDAKEETAFTFFNEREEILSTVLDCSKFEITESEVDVKYKEGTVTIELKYPDAEEISESYFDIEFDEYLDEIREVKPNKTKKITIDFVLKDDDWLVTKKSDKKFKETLESLVANIELEPYNGGGSSDPVPDPGVVADPLAENKIGISMPTKDLMRWNSDGNMLKSQLESQGFNVDLQYASNDINTQISQIENQINQGCKILIIAAISPESLSKVVEEARDKGITVICYDRIIMNAQIDYYVTFDNYAVGELQAEYIVNQLGLDSAPAGTTYNIEITAGDPSDMNAEFFYNGAIDVLQPYIDSQKATASFPRREGQGGGSILLATVKGDVHDIGKNIVSVVMACNNYKITDLGVMVPAEQIVEAVLREQPDIIGLSGLITPSLQEMCNTAEALRDAGISIPLMIGGATTSALHTALKIAPLYSGPVVWVKDASQNSIIAAQLLNPTTRDSYIAALRADQQALRDAHIAKQPPMVSLQEARANKLDLFSDKE